MKTLLRLDASARSEGSSSRRLTDHYQRRWTAAHPGGRVVVRDLARDPAPHLDAATIAAFYGAAPEGPPPAGLGLSDVLIAELRAADHLLIGSPMYNSTIASALKAYIDHVVRAGHSFAVVDGRRVGLLSHLAATIVTVRGGFAAADDFHSDYLRRILGFIGIDDVEVVALAGTVHEGAAGRFAAARARIDERFAQPRE